MTSVLAPPIETAVPLDDDWALVQKCVRGDTQAFRPLVERHQRLAFSVALRLVTFRADAEDVVQHSFVEAFRALPRFDGAGSPGAFRVWLLRIVVNRAKDILKSKQRQVASLDDQPDGADGLFCEASLDPERQAQAHATQRGLLAALQKLPEKYRTALVLKDVEDLSYEEMRSVLRLPITTLKIRVVRARAMMRTLLDPKAEL